VNGGRIFIKINGRPRGRPFLCSGFGSAKIKPAVFKVWLGGHPRASGRWSAIPAKINVAFGGISQYLKHYQRFKFGAISAAGAF
jgi:hypothetical protein